MGSFIIENFANGLDTRRSHDTAPPGSLRVLRNAFINEGGEIEKAKGFLRHTALTAYGQTANYKGKISGPFIVNAGSSLSHVVFRHRHNSLPSSGWTAGAGSVAVKRQIGSTPDVTVWAMKSTAPLTNFGALFRLCSDAFFGDTGHIIEGFVPNAATTLEFQHFAITVDVATNEPTAEAIVAANNNRPSMMILRDKGYFNIYRAVSASAVGDPADMAGTGSGAFDTRTQSKPIGRIVGFGDYYGQLAVFGTRGGQFWSMDPDFSKNQYERSVPLTAVAPRAIIGYGDGDVAYLARDGVRSLRARDSSNIAGISDFGSPIDRLIKAALRDLTALGESMSGAPSTFLTDPAYYPPIMEIHPDTGALWLFLHDKIYVFSHYPDAGVRAWSMIDLPAPAPANLSAQNGTLKSRWAADVCPVNDDLLIRNFADEVYLYGGLDGVFYDTTLAEVITPHMDMGKPGKNKHIHGIDLSCLGTWTIEVSLDPANVVWEEIATVTNTTYRLAGRVACNLEATHIALRLTSTSASAARIGQVAIYFEGDDDK